MQITRLETFSTADVGFVRVTADSGAQGWGQLSPYNADITALETAMDDMNTVLPEMRHFILPGGHPAVSQAHICRTVCRRAERAVVTLGSQEAVPEHIIRYLNRLSDLFFMLARWLGHTLGSPEIPWKPRG